LNFLLIPEMGIAGAAIASVATQIFTNFILGFIHRPIRANNWLVLKGFDPRGLVDTVKIVLRRK
jgi:O-antigen/teichoic acid export membrane protein